MKINPYINFDGNAREAMEFYQKALGGKLDLLTFDKDNKTIPAGPNDPIMHSRLESDGALIMGSDGLPDRPPKVGDNVGVSLIGSNKDKLTKIFNDLSEDGKVNMPLEESTWGDVFGMFTDKFGINWMVDIGSDNE
jgi:PhnB protein